MALEGQIRDLSLTEVLQLLALGRKQGALHVEAPLQGRCGTIVFRQGAIVDAVVEPLSGIDRAVHPNRRQEDAHLVEDAVLDVLAWREGYFRFAPAENPAPDSAVHMAIEPMLMEAALRAEVWARIDSRVPHARVVPAFIEVEAQQLPLLRLSPAQWELLTRIDGQQDLMALASTMSRPLIEIAEMVHDLIASGVLTLHDGQAPQRRNPTPPAMVAVDPHDLWIPGNVVIESDLDDDLEFDAVFDPIEVGVLTPEGMPRQRTPMVAQVAIEPSVDTTEAVSLADAALGDSLAREGDMHGALALWHRALRGSLPAAVAARLREQASLTARLAELLS
ncbi:MAG: DUF4388 domain-containing protein [Gemmatimonadaceae bacterium]|nr:DUF4388 domain-containing protein [Gemmatimonadaceae bacterium]